MTQYGFFFDQSRCYNCHTCSVACKSWHGHEPGPVKWLRVFNWEKGAFPEPRLYSLVAPCYHCESPACVTACPTKAIYKEEKYGAVLVDPGLCDGCRDCWEACDYGAPQFANDTPGTKMSKCNMCIDRLEEGLQPLCVLSCPMRALDFGPLDEMIEKYGNLRALPEMPDPGRLQPAIVFKPQAERKKLISYDPVKSLQLLGNRGNLPPVYEDVGEVTEIPDGLIKSDHLNMKPKNTRELMVLTRNDEG